MGLLEENGENWRRRVRSALDKQGWLVLAAAATVLISASLLLEALPPSRVSATPVRERRIPAPIPAPPSTLRAASVTAPQSFEAMTPAQALASNDAAPFSSAPNPAAQPFKLATADPDERNRALTCLAMAVYYEAGNQGPDGEAAIAQVVLNRLRHPIFPKTVCGVVFEGSELTTGCQFTFTCDGSLRRRPSAEGWRQAMQVAERALDGHVQADVGVATHYHTVWVVPYWRASVEKVVKIGAHIFYRLPGVAGQASAFVGRYGGPELIPAALHQFEAPAPVVAVASDPPSAVAAVAEVHPVEAVQPARIASLTTGPALLGAVTPVDPANDRRKGYFGRGGADSQHLAAPGQW